MQMFIVYTLLFMLSGVAMFKFMWLAIQEGQMLGKYQRFLTYLRNRGLYNLENFLGGCEMCFSHFMAIVSFILYNIFMREMDMYLVKSWLNIVWYLVYVCTVWYLSFLTIKKDK